MVGGREPPDKGRSFFRRSAGVTSIPAPLPRGSSPSGPLPRGSSPSGQTDAASGVGAGGVRLMQEPGFAAHDSHLYRRQTLNRVLERSKQEDAFLTLANYYQGQGHQNGLANGRTPSSSPAGFVSRTSNGLPFYPGRKASPAAGEKEVTRRRPSPPSGSRRSPYLSSSTPSHVVMTTNGKDPDDCESGDLSTNFRLALAKNAPPVPLGLLKMLGGTRQVPLLGKVRVYLRESPTIRLEKGEESILLLDKKRRQVTLQEARQQNHMESRVGVSAPKIFAFDQVFSKDESKAAVLSGVLPDMLHAVLAGNDGCIMSFGSCQMGKSDTMVGSDFKEGQMGVIPSAIAWLYRSIAELKSKSGIRFSVRVSALAVDAPGKIATDVLGEFAQDSETSPANLLREGGNGGGLLSSAIELRASSSETAARYLDLALSAREAIGSVQHRNGTTGPATLLYTLHVYQYSVDKASKGGVIGGRSRLHLLDLGDMSGRCPGGMSLSSLSSVLLAIFNGQKYLPHRDNKLTHLLQDTLGLLTCHVAMVVHVSPSTKHSQHSLATMQLASRVHRMRRKKLRGVGGSGSGGSSEGSNRRGRSSGEDNSGGSSSIDISSSEQSADTVIYIGGGGPGDSTDGEHPPIFLPHHIRRRHPGELPRLRSLEQLRPHTASPVPIQSRRPASASPTPTSRSVPLGKPVGIKPKPPVRSYSNGGSDMGGISSPSPLGFFRHQPGVSKIYPDTRQSSQLPLLSSFKPREPTQYLNHPNDGRQMNYNVYREPNAFVPTYRGNPEKSPQIFFIHNPYTLSQQPNSYIVDNGKRLSEGANQAHAKEFIQQNIQPHQFNPAQHPQQTTQQEKVHQQTQEKQPSANGLLLSDEQWIDGPRISKAKVVAARSRSGRSETWIDGPSSTKAVPVNYGFMDDHKKTMIEKWVENQTAQVVSKSLSGSSSPTIAAQAKDASPPSVTQKEKYPDLNKINSNEEVVVESDVDTLSEAAASATGDKQPDLIQELERKNLIPSQAEPEEIGTKEGKDKEGCHFYSNDEKPIEDICSQCEALAEECEDLNSLLSCEEDECKRQVHQGLATVMEEPELESALGGDDKDDDLSLLNHPQTDCDECDVESDVVVSGSTLSRRRLTKIKTAETSVQVCHEDIIRCMSDTPCPSEVTGESSDEHPLRALSEENLTCASTFTDSCSQMGETGDEDSEGDESSTPLEFLEVSDYVSIYKDITEALQSDVSNRNIDDLSHIHDIFKALSHNQALTSESEKKTLNVGVQEPFCQVPREDSSLYSIEPVFDSEDTLCKHCNKKKARHKNNIYKLASCDSDSAYHSSQQMNICMSDKCIGTEEDLAAKTERCKCPSPSEFVSNSNLTNSVIVSQEANINCNLALVTNNFNNVMSNGEESFVTNEVKLSSYIKDEEDNVVVHQDATHYHKESDFSFPQDGVLVLEKSDEESDCLSTASEDSEYIMQNSKLSKFLCVGIGKSKSKTSLKQKQNKNCESKRNLFKFKESKVKSIAKVGKSPDASSKNLIRSPSRSTTQNIDRNNSSQINNPVREQPKGNIEHYEMSTSSFKYKCAVCYSGSTCPKSSESGYDRTTASINPKSWKIPQNLGTNPSVSQPLQSAIPKRIVHSTGTNGSVGTTQSLGESSGYESIPRDSECSSFSSSQESEMDEEQRREIHAAILKRGNAAEIFKHSDAGWCRGHDPVQTDANNIPSLPHKLCDTNFGEQPRRYCNPLLQKKIIPLQWTAQSKHNRC